MLLRIAVVVLGQHDWQIDGQRKHAVHSKQQRRRNDKGNPTIKAAQLDALRKICERLCADLQDDAADVTFREPLMWMVHGGPGTGKPEVLLLCKQLFAEVCGWKMGIEC